MAESDIEAKTNELESLMREFPDWKDKFPEIYREINPPRYSKLAGKGDPFRLPSEKITQRRATTVPHTDYQNTFRRHNVYRPRSTKRPPPSPRDPYPPPMTFETFQRSEFTPKDVTVRTEPVKMEEQYKAPEGTVETHSSYQRDFPVRKPLPELRFSMTDWRQKSLNPLSSKCKFDGHTTTHDHYQPWTSAPAKPFSELPTFTGSILYPESGHRMETTTSTTFRGMPGRRAELKKLTGATIKIEGDMDMNTTNKLVFHSFDDARPAKMIVNEPTLITGNRAKFEAETQTKKDFPGYNGRQPRRRKPAQPAPETIDLKFDNKHEFSTEQRRQFPGIDPKDHPVPKSCKKDPGAYKAPEVKFESISSQKHDYQPIDIEQVYMPPTKPIERKDKDPKPKLDDMTMNKEFFKKWEIPARIRYGDFHEGHSYVPPASKFEAKTTNQDVFLGKPSEIPRSFKPEDKAIDLEGENDFNTMYKLTFKKPVAAKMLSKKQASLLLNELRNRKTDRTVAVHWG